MVDVVNNEVNIDNQDNNEKKTNIFSARNATDFISILTFIGLIGITYKYNPLKFLTNNLLTAIRIKYLSIMVLFLSLVFVMYYYDLLNLSTDYFGPVTITSLVIGCFLFGGRRESRQIRCTWCLLLPVFCFLRLIFHKEYGILLETGFSNRLGVKPS